MHQRIEAENEVNGVVGNAIERFAIVDEEFTVKRLFQRGQLVRLLAENPAFPPIVLKEGQELRIWGVVTFNLHKLLNV